MVYFGEYRWDMVLYKQQSGPGSVILTGTIVFSFCSDFLERIRIAE
jgi:hypothetical protein